MSDHKREGAPRQESAFGNKYSVSLSQNTLERKQIGFAVGNVELERAIIGSLLFTPAVMLPIAKQAGLESSHFSDPILPEIFERVIQAERELENMDSASLSRYLASKGTPFPILSELQTGNSVTEQPGIVEHWCQEIKDAAVGRTVAEKLAKTVERLKAGERP